MLAKSLAEKLGWQFIDGENAFHDCESEILATQLLKENIVVTTDPAIVCSEKIGSYCHLNLLSI